MDGTAIVTGAGMTSAAGTVTAKGDALAIVTGAGMISAAGLITSAPIPGVSLVAGTFGAPRPPTPDQGTRLDLGSMLHAMTSIHPQLGEALRRLQDGVNELADNAGVSSIGPMPSPPPLQSVNIKTSGELVHISINHQAPISKGIRYFTEVSTDPSFSQPVVYDHGSSRTPPPLNLPSKDDNGDPQTFYFRHYSQYRGSPASPILVHGGSTPTGVTLGGTTQMTLLPSTGSGTASPTGTQGGQGAGTNLFRPQTGPKRADMNR